MLNKLKLRRRLALATPIVLAMTLAACASPATPAVQPTIAPSQPSETLQPTIAPAQPTTPSLVPTLPPPPTADAQPTIVPPPLQPTAVPPAQPTATVCAPSVVATDDDHVRTGPGLNYPILGFLNSGVQAAVTGRAADNSWYQINAPSASGSGWVFSGIVATNCVENVPVVSAPPPPPTAPPPPPPTAVIQPSPTPGASANFWADSTTISSGQCTTLRWSTSNVDNVYFNDNSGSGNQGVSGNDARQVCPGASTTYFLNVQLNSGQWIQRAVTISVVGSPNVSFWADNTTINFGQCTTVRWNTSNVQAVYFNSGSGDQGVNGNDARQVCPGTTTTYYLNVDFNNGQVVQQSVTINVDSVGPPTAIPIQPTIQPPIGTMMVFGASNGRNFIAITRGQCTTLSWRVAGSIAQSGSAIVLNVGGQSSAVPYTGSQQVCPQNSVVATLTVNWADGTSATKNVAITVL